MKKIFEEPEVKVIKVQENDVIATSGECGSGFEELQLTGF